MKKAINIFLIVIIIVQNISCEQSNKVESRKEINTELFNDSVQVFLPTPVNLDSIIFEIKKIDEVQYEHIGSGGLPSKNYANFKYLSKVAKTEELLYLIDNENSTVSCYASWALVDRSYPKLKSIFEKIILNDREVNTYNCSVGSKKNISSELYSKYWNKIDESKRENDDILFQLDSVIIYSENLYWLLMHRALNNRVYIEPYKSRIALLAFEQENIEAVYYLCNWHKAEYINQIKVALVNYLNKTDFSNTGTTDYYKTIDELFKLNDPKIRKEIILKMKKDRHWEYDKEHFESLLSVYHIFDIDNE